MSDDRLYTTHQHIAKVFDDLIADCPDPDGGDFYTQRANPGLHLLTDGQVPEAATKPSAYGGWRTKLDQVALSHLRGFRQGLDHARRVIVNNGGVTVWGILMGTDPLEVLRSIGRDVEAETEAVTRQGKVRSDLLAAPKKNLTADEAREWALRIIGAAAAADGVLHWKEIQKAEQEMGQDGLL
jgi:hypothetical protein